SVDGYGIFQHQLKRRACFKAGQFCKKGKEEETGSQLWRTPFCQLWGLTPLEQEKEGETAPHQ
uniref:Uncharacterized protein n=1 Tax=Theropithecus gelada TaxID=9565 RepID=A0A8D2F5P1_THEGE